MFVKSLGVLAKAVLRFIIYYIKIDERKISEVVVYEK